MAPAVFITGSQSGLVELATSTSPGLKKRRSAVLVMTRTRPVPIFSPTALPRTSTGAVPFRVYVSKKSESRRDATVSGRA